MFKFLIFLLFILVIFLCAVYIYGQYRSKKEDEKYKKINENQIDIINTGKLLEIRIERDSDIDVLAIEQLWKYFSSIAEVDDEFYNPYISFEIKGERDDYLKKDEITFNIWIPSRFESTFISRLRTIYPTVGISELKEDYMPDFNDRRLFAVANMGLSRHYVYPINTTVSIKESDPLKTIIGAMSSLENKEKAIFQVLLKPINDDWKEGAKDFLKEYELESILPETKRKNGFINKFLFGAFKILSTFIFDFLFKSGKDIVEKYNGYFEDETIEKGKIENAEISNITDKITSVGYSVDFRVLVATPYGRKRAENKLDQICASFKELDFDNKIVKKPISDIEEFMFNLSNRWYPIKYDNDIMSTKEISMFCHLPNMNNSVITKQITTRVVDCPPGLSTENLLGYGMRGGKKVPVGIDSEARFRHMWIGGQTGTGKSTIMENMIVNDIHNGKGLLLIDPHGETALHVAERCSTERKDIYYLDLSDIANPPTINLFEVFNTDYAMREQEKSQIVENFIIIFKRVFGSQSIGPNTEDILRNAAYAVLELPEGASLLDIYLMLTSSTYQKKVVQFLDDKPPLKAFWEKTFATLQQDTRYQQQNLNPPLNKLRRFINDPIIANMLCPKKSTINIKQIMDTGAVVLVNISKGRLGELTGNVIGSLLVSQVQISTMMRSGLPDNKMTPFFMYIDEFENFIGGEGGAKAFESILSEARKYKLGLIVANQYMHQLKGANGDIQAAIFGNCGTVGVYRVGNDDAPELEREFSNGGRGFTKEDLVNTDKYTMAIRLMNDGAKSMPFTLFVNPPHKPHPTANPEFIKKYSRDILTIPKKQAELEIIRNMQQYEQ